MKKVKEIKKQFIFPENQTGFKDCHSNTHLKIGPKDYLVVYFAGTKEGTPDLGIWLSRCKDGIWLPPRRIKFIYLLPHWNPVIIQSGSRIFMYYKVGMSPQKWYTMVSYSDDLGETWSESVEAVPGDYRPRAGVRNKFIVATNGYWLAPTSKEEGNDFDCYIDISKDKGKTWEISPIPLKHQSFSPIDPNKLGEIINKDLLWECNPKIVEKWDGVIQPTLWESSPGHIHALMRSTRDRIMRSDSADYGATWCEAYMTDMPNNCCGIDVDRFNDGSLVLVYNPVAQNWGPRSPLSISFSEDNGKTFSEPVHLETKPGEYSYPSVRVEDDKHINILYTHNRATFVHCEVILE